MKNVYFTLLILLSCLLAGCEVDDGFNALQDSIPAEGALNFPGRVYNAEAGLVYAVSKTATDFEIQLEVPSGEIATIDAVYARMGRVTVFGPVGSATQVIGAACGFPVAPNYTNIKADNTNKFTFKVKRSEIDALKCSGLTPTSPFYYDFRFSITLTNGKKFQSSTSYYARVYPNL